MKLRFRPPKSVLKYKYEKWPLMIKKKSLKIWKYINDNIQHLKVLNESE